MGIGSFLLEWCFIDEIMWIGLGELIVSLFCILWWLVYSLNICCYVWIWYFSCFVYEIVFCIIIFKMFFIMCFNVCSVIFFIVVKFKFFWNLIFNFVWLSVYNFCRYGEYLLWWFNEMRLSIGEKGVWLLERFKDVLVVMFLDVL